MVPFVTNTDFLVRYDGRWVGKQVLDDSTAATVAQLQDDTSAGGSVLLALLVEASDLVMGASAVAARYSENDLRTYGGSLLTRIVCDLTIGLVLKRRGRAVSDEKALSGPYYEAMAYLEQLRRGERIFWAVPDVPQAGLPESVSQNPYPLLPGQVPQTAAVAARYFGFPAAYQGYKPYPFGLTQ